MHNYGQLDWQVGVITPASGPLNFHVLADFKISKEVAEAGLPRRWLPEPPHSET